MRRLGIAVVLLAAACGGGEAKGPAASPVTGSPGAVAAAAGCRSVFAWPDEGRTHIQPPARVSYRTDPPTSGQHYPTPAQTGIHTSPVQDEATVHNLEHGHVILHYVPGRVGRPVLAAIEEVVRRAPSAILLTPRTGDHPYAVVFVAWRVSQACSRPNAKVKDAALQFVSRYVGHGPEGLLPGQPTAETPS
jgi:hypothetical protein